MYTITKYFTGGSETYTENDLIRFWDTKKEATQAMRELFFDRHSVHVEKWTAEMLNDYLAFLKN